MCSDRFPNSGITICCFLLIGCLTFFPSCTTLETGISNFADMVLPQKATFTVDAPAAYPATWDIQSIQVQAFDVNSSHHRDEAKQLQHMIKNGIAQEGYIRALETGGDALVKGDLTIGKLQADSYRNSYETDDGIEYVYYYTKKLPVTGNFSLIDQKSNRVIVGDSFSYSFDNKWRSSNSPSDAKAQAVSNEQILHGILEKVSREIVWAVSPHKETVTRTLEKGSDKSIRLGNKYLENNSPDQAILIWREVLEKSDDPEDIAAAHYNIGVVMEARGEFDKAKSMFEEANLLLPERELYIEARERVRKAEARQRRLGGQTRNL